MRARFQRVTARAPLRAADPPDMAGDLRRAHAAISECAHTVARPLGIPRSGAQRAVLAERLAGAAITALGQRTAGTQREAVLEVLTDTARDLLVTERDTLAADLSLRTGVPAPALRSTVGFPTALRSETAGHPETGLPNTPLGRQLARLELLQTELERLSRGTTPAQWERAWDSTPRHGTFDATIDELHGQAPYIAELGWALITFETHKHVNLIWHQANKLVRSFPDRTSSDLLGWGWLGLRVALRHYNPELGFSFSTYACSRIIGSIRDGVRSENPVPKRLNTFTRKVAAAEASLTQVLGRSPSLEEVSHSIGVELDSLSILPRTAPQASIDELLAGMSERGTSPAWMVDPNDPADTALKSMTAQAVARAMAQLPADEAQAVQLLVMDGMNPTEARALTGATARQLRQRKERGLAQLRHYLAQWDDAEDSRD